MGVGGTHCLVVGLSSVVIYSSNSYGGARRVGVKLCGLIVVELLCTEEALIRFPFSPLFFLCKNCMP